MRMSYADKRERADFLARRVRNASRRLWRIAGALSGEGVDDLEQAIAYMKKAGDSVGDPLWLRQRERAREEWDSMTRKIERTRARASEREPVARTIEGSVGR